MPKERIVLIQVETASFMQKLPALLAILFILTGAMSSCKDDPITPPGGKDTCDTCICDTCTIDTTDTTIVVSPNDTTSHDFIWSESSIPGEASIGGCWVFNDTTIWVLGDKLYTLSNGSWVHKPLKNDKGWDLNSGLSGSKLFGFTPNNTWMWATGIIWHYKNDVAHEYRIYQDGTGLLNYPEDGELRAAWGTSSNDMFFVGDNGVIVHFDGTNWMKFPKVTQKHLRSIWGTSHNDVWASGFNLSTAETILLHYDGSSWSEVDLSRDKGIYATGGFNTVWTVDSASHKVTMTAGAILQRQTDNNPWRSDSGKISSRLQDGGWVPLYTIRGNSANDVMLAGGGGWIGHWNGSTWYQYTTLFNWHDVSYDTYPMDFKGNTAIFTGKKAGKGFVALGRRF